MKVMLFEAVLDISLIKHLFILYMHECVILGNDLTRIFNKYRVTLRPDFEIMNYRSAGITYIYVGSILF